MKHLSQSTTEASKRATLPTLAMNLLSVSQLCDLGLIVKFDKQHVTVKRNGDVVLQGARKGGFYIYKTTNAGNTLQIALTELNSSIVEWDI
jgi:hypothetical protein